jgi:SAM-dependent methyltransferase
MSRRDPDEYAEFARDYDAIYEKLRRPSKDAAFYLRLARKARGPVLELGCGSGRLLLPIARAGIPAVGLDASPAMLDVLAAKSPPPNLHLVRGRMESFDLGRRRFSLIFAGFRAFQHLVRVEDQLAALSRIRAHLAPGGVFAFDVFSPRHDRLARGRVPEVEDARFTRDGETVLRYAAISWVDTARQILNVRFRFEKIRKGRRARYGKPWQSPLRYFFRYELEHLLARAGFADVEIRGGFSGEPYDSRAKEIVVVARAEPSRRRRRRAGRPSASGRPRSRRPRARR